jgi:hypothetical protein
MFMICSGHGRIPIPESEAARSRCESLLLADVHRKGRDIMNFMNFAFRQRPFGALEFVERHATSGPE